MRTRARRYPVGMLKGNGTLPDIKIHFLHYRSFEEAREKWLERSGRLDFDNLCVVMQAAELDEGLWNVSNGCRYRAK